jgi:aldehyde:ferredoxin oxidoreductase
MANGYMGKVLWVDLSAGTIRAEPLDEQIARDYVGGYGYGARVLYETMRPGVDPLGPDNILGFLTGPLTGSPSIEGNRSVFVCKSPLTGGWGDANCGGTFGPFFKFAGYDAAFFTGASEKPVYLWIGDGTAELRDAADLWGQDAHEAEHALQARHGKGTEVAVIGQSGERLSQIACIMNDEGRAWGRSGVGAVMGSKKLKAIAVKGTQKVPLADEKRSTSLRREYMKKHTGLYDFFSDFGTTAIIGSSSYSGDSPVKNWFGAGTTDFPTGRVNYETEHLRKTYNDKKYGCWRCTMACGGHMSVKEEGPYKGLKHHKVEYETGAAFGSMMLNDNFPSLLKANELCNKYGLDTIAAGCTITFAMDCYNRGIITIEDTDGIDLSWGNHEGIIAMLQKLALREGFGDVLADGVKKASERIGRGSEVCAIHIGGAEVPMHDPRLTAGLAPTYQLDATPARHTQGGELTAYPDQELPHAGVYTGRAEFHRRNVAGTHFINAAGVCLFGYNSYPIDTWLDFMTSVTGETWDFDRMMETGERIGTIRHLFNLREGINPLELHVPPVILGNPPLTEGNVRGVTVDGDTMNREYLELIDWDTKTTVPSKTKLAKLGLDRLANDLVRA